VQKGSKYPPIYTLPIAEKPQKPHREHTEKTQEKKPEFNRKKRKKQSKNNQGRLRRKYYDGYCSKKNVNPYSNTIKENVNPYIHF
jgi:hypothetical protein